jgi:hypothetical protein
MSEGQLVVEPAIEGQRRAGSLPLFFAFTFAVTWTCFISAVALSDMTPSGSSLGPVLQGLVFLGTIAPSLVALALTARLEGRAGTQALLSRVTQWRVGARWYAFAIGYMAAMKLTVALVHRVITGT